MDTYTTVQGDMWDKIAYEQLGSCNYTGELMKENMSLLNYAIFPAGIVLNLPLINMDDGDLPSWRMGLDDEEDDLDEWEEELDE